MKRLLALLLALVMVLTLVACGDTADDDVQDNDTPGVADDNAPDGTPDTDDVDVYNPSSASALEIMTEIWNAYPGDENGDKFMSFGGAIESDDFVENAPANHPIGDGSMLDDGLGYPADMIDKIDEAVALRHMMNVNTFSCGAYHVVNADDVQAVCDGIEHALMNRSYLCGAPQWLVIVVVDNSYVVNIFGAEDLVNGFKDTALSLYGNAAVIAYDESMEGAHGDNGIDMGGLGIGIGF